MNKLLIALMLILMGCGSGNGTTPTADTAASGDTSTLSPTPSPNPTPVPTPPPLPTPAPTPTPGPICKPINSVWTLQSSSVSSSPIVSFPGFGNNYQFWIPYLEGNYYSFDFTASSQTYFVNSSQNYLTGVKVPQQEWGNEAYAVLILTINATTIDFTPVGCFLVNGSGYATGFNCPIAAYSYSYTLNCNSLEINGATYY